jgi:hypothetical protein
MRPPRFKGWRSTLQSIFLLLTIKLKQLIQTAAKKAAKNTIILLETDKPYKIWANHISYFEEIILETVHYDMFTPLPHTHLPPLLSRFILARNETTTLERIGRDALRACDESMDTTLYIRYPVEIIAYACLHAACRIARRGEPGDARERPVLVDGQGVAWFISLKVDIRLIEGYLIGFNFFSACFGGAFGT